MEPSGAVVHGALDYAELTALGLRPETLLDFSSNVNPFGPPSSVLTALAHLDPAPYPDRSCLRLRAALAEHHACALEAVLPGNGANELIHLIARALLRPTATVLVIGPTYGEYAYASRLCGAQVIERCAKPGDRFQLDLDQLMTAIAAYRPYLTWLCAPNNPTGVDLPAAALRALCAWCAVHGGLLVLDQTYAPLRRAAVSLSDELDHDPPPNLIRLASLTKSHALAGLRLGYLIATPDLVAQIAAHQPAWSVNSAAQAAGLAALRDATFLPATLPRLWASSDSLHTGLTVLGLEVWRDALPFMLVRTGDGAATRAALLRRGCVVRDCASFGLPEWVRVAPRRPEENARLLTAWRECL